jgi:hypothetical protein
MCNSPQTLPPMNGRTTPHSPYFWAFNIRISWFASNPAPTSPARIGSNTANIRRYVASVGICEFSSRPLNCDRRPIAQDVSHQVSTVFLTARKSRPYLLQKPLIAHHKRPTHQDHTGRDSDAVARGMRYHRTYDLGVNSDSVQPVNFDQFTEAACTVGLYWLLLNQSRPVGDKQGVRTNALAYDLDNGTAC